MEFSEETKNLIDFTTSGGILAILAYLIGKPVVKGSGLDLLIKNIFSSSTPVVTNPTNSSRLLCWENLVKQSKPLNNTILNTKLADIAPLLVDVTIDNTDNEVAS